MKAYEEKQIVFPLGGSVRPNSADDVMTELHVSLSLCGSSAALGIAPLGEDV